MGTQAKVLAGMVEGVNVNAFKEPEEWLALLYLQASLYVQKTIGCIQKERDVESRKSCGELVCSDVFKKEQCDFVNTVAGSDKKDPG